MPRTTSNPFLNIAHGDLAYAVMRLVALGKVSERQIRQFIQERSTRLAELEAELAALRAGADGARRGPGRPRKNMTGAAVPRKRRTITRTPKMLEARKKQGRYLGLRRGLPAAQQKQATKIANTQGVDAALKFIEGQRKKAA